MPTPSAQAVDEHQPPRRPPDDAALVDHRRGQPAVPVVAPAEHDKAVLAADGQETDVRVIRSTKVPPEPALVAAVDLNRVVGRGGAKDIAPRPAVGVAAGIHNHRLPIEPEDEGEDVCMGMRRQVRRA